MPYKPGLQGVLADRVRSEGFDDTPELQMVDQPCVRSEDNHCDVECPHRKYLRTMWVVQGNGRRYGFEIARKRRDLTLASSLDASARSCSRFPSFHSPRALGAARGNGGATLPDRYGAAGAQVTTAQTAAAPPGNCGADVRSPPADVSVSVLSCRRYEPATCGTTSRRASPVVRRMAPRVAAIAAQRMVRCAATAGVDADIGAVGRRRLADVVRSERG